MSCYSLMASVKVTVEVVMVRAVPFVAGGAFVRTTRMGLKAKRRRSISALPPFGFEG